MDEHTQEVVDKAFNKVMEFWHCTDEERQKLESQPYGKETVIGIFGKLAALFGNFRHEWVRSPNTEFDNRTALSVMTDDEKGIDKVYLYLDNSMMGW